MSSRSSYPQHLRERTVRMVAEIRPDYETDWAVLGAVAARLDNALMKSAIGLYKTEPISKRSSGRR
jgi:hypothetical protein